ncbi:class II D-tagatose-bisphosphate aldolase, non-catalytic subunit [Patescibacteria group bacterium]|nr:class II D-tagatose-bisphosphate aldolase, non-catalytic subunit [Patescibacteria group bacterium]
MDLLMKKIKHISRKEKENYTLLAVCSNSKNVLNAAIRSAKRANAQILLAATLNEVDIDGGYTSWTHNDFVRITKEISSTFGFNGPIIIAIYHGGP